MTEQQTKNLIAVNKFSRNGSVSARKIMGFGGKLRDPSDSVNLSDGTQTVETSKVRFTAVGQTSDISAMFLNGAQPLNTVTTAANSITLTASIEYTFVDPTGATSTVIVPFTFNGGATSFLLPWQRTVVTDPLPIEIVSGAAFYIRTCVTVTAGQKWYKPIAVSSSYSEGYVSGSDYTVSGTIPNSQTLTFGPLCVLGVTNSRKGSIFITGDSIGRGNGDSGFTQYGYLSGGGMFGRAIANNNNVFFACRDGERADNWLPNTRPQLSPLFGLTDFFLDGLGINDIGNSLATMQANALALWDSHLARGVYGYRTTLTPSTTGTYTTTAGQTVTVNESKRVGFNDWIRDGAPIHADTRAAQSVGTKGANIIRAGQAGHPLLGYFDTADVVESARNSGLWANASGTAYTADGLHPNSTSYPLLAAAIDTTKFYLW